MSETRRKEHQARSRAAELLTNRLNLLLDTSTVLASSTDKYEMFDRLAAILVPDVADWCSVGVPLQDGRIERIGLKHRIKEAGQKLSDLLMRQAVHRDATVGIGYAIRTGQSQLIPRFDARRLLDDFKGTELARQLTPELIDAAGIHSYLSVPMLSEGQAIGAITLVRGQAWEEFNPTDLLVMEEVARRGALALSTLLRLERLTEERDRNNEILKLYQNFLIYRIEDSKAPLTAARLKAELIALDPDSSRNPVLLRKIQEDVDRAVSIMNSIIEPHQLLEHLRAKVGKAA